MWRIALFISLVCSVMLNIYLFIQLNMHSLEKKLQQGTSINSPQGVAHLKNNNRKNKVINNNDERAEASQQVVNNIKKALKAKDYFSAGFLINTLANDHNVAVPAVRLFWLHTIENLIEQKSFTHAENSINAYLAFQADDDEFLYQQVDLYWQQQLPLTAIKYAYEMQYHIFNEAKNRLAVNFARELVQKQLDVFINNNLWLELRDFVEEIMLFDPEDLNLQWLYVRAQFHLGEFEYALNAIAPLLNEPNYKIKAQALLADIEAALRQPQSIPLSRQGEHFIVQALINDAFNISLMLDTGASISLFSESAFTALSQYSDVVYIKDLQLNTAGGIVTASIYQVAEFAIQDYIVNDFIFAVSPYAGESNDGLLGMNFLRSFDFHIDQDNSRLILKNK